jgi:hypothetical protein
MQLLSPLSRLKIGSSVIEEHDKMQLLSLVKIPVPFEWKIEEHDKMQLITPLYENRFCKLILEEHKIKILTT